MPCLYRRYADEIHVYHTRMPNKDGAGPGLFKSVAGAFFLFLFSFMAVFAFTLNHVLFSEPSPEIDRHAAWIALMVLIYCWVFSSYWQKLVFSSRTGTVTRGFLLKKTVGRFEDFSGVVLEEFGGSLWFSLAWKDGFKKPFRLSPMVKDNRRLATYYHEIVPLLTECMGLPPFHGVDPELSRVVMDVFGEPAPAAAIGPGDISGENEYRYFVHSRKTGLYRSRITAATIVFGTVFLAVLVAVGWAAFHFEIRILQIFWSVFVALLLWGLRKECFTYRLDPRGRAVVAYTLFGFKKNRLPLENLARIGQIQFAFFRSALLFFNRDGPKMVGLVDVISAGAIRESLLEFGQIMGVDVEAFLEESVLNNH